jgi:hypothetical protein
MPVYIDELSSNFEVRDEAQLRKLVREEVRAAMADEKKRGKDEEDDGEVQNRRSDPEP